VCEVCEGVRVCEGGEVYGGAVGACERCEQCRSGL
jgi:hypothetical protein